MAESGKRNGEGPTAQDMESWSDENSRLNVLQDPGGFLCRLQLRGKVTVDLFFVVFFCLGLYDCVACLPMKQCLNTCDGVQIDLPPERIFDILTDPDNSKVFKSIKVWSLDISISSTTAQRKLLCVRSPAFLNAHAFPTVGSDVQPRMETPRVNHKIISPGPPLLHTTRSMLLLPNWKSSSQGALRENGKTAVRIEGNRRVRTGESGGREGVETD